MDAKSKAKFINSVAGGQGIPCPNCNRLNLPDAKYCVACGTMLIKKEEPEQDEQAVIYCPSCGTGNDEGAVFCFACGFRIDAGDEAVMEEPEEEITDFNESAEEEAVETASAPAFKKIAEEKPAVKPAAVKKAVARRIINFAVPEEDTEEASVFAKGLPAWDIVPPEIAVRRKAKS